MLRLTRSLFVAAAALAATTSLAQIKATNGGYLFRVKYTKGQVLKYKMTTLVKSQGMTMVNPIKLKVADVVKGIATIQASVGPMVLNGNPMSKQPNSASFKLDSRNKPVGTALSGVENMTSVGFPAKPIKVGATWSDKATSAPSMGATMTVKVTYTFVGIKTIGGKKVAVLNEKIKGSGQATATGSGTIYILVADGTYLQADYTMNIGISTGSSPITMNTNVSIKRQ